MDPDTPCVCGDVLDEHETVNGPCLVEGCDCTFFEEDTDG